MKTTKPETVTEVDFLQNISETEMEQYQRDYYNYLRQFYAENTYTDRNTGNDVQTSPWPWYIYPSQAPWSSPCWNANGNAQYYCQGWGQPTHPVTTQSETPVERPDANVAGGNQWFRGARAVLADLGVLDHGPDVVVPAHADREVAGGDVAPQQAMMVGNPMAAGMMGPGEFGENGANLDIVDRFYMVFRLFLFIGLCFAYSSLDKAIIVFSIAAYVYFYNIYRRHAALREAAVQAQRPPQPNLVQPPTEANTTEPSVTNTNNLTEQHLRERTSTHELTNSGINHTTLQVAIQPEPRLSRITSALRVFVNVSFQFVAALITSLIPEQPPPMRLD